MEDKNNIKTIMYFHAGSDNHGCEAIVRSTSDLLGVRPILFSDNPLADEKYSIDDIVDIRQVKKTPYNLTEKFRIKISGSDKLAYQIKASHESREYEPFSIALSIGGDNYCYGDTYNWHLSGLNKSLHDRKIKTVLWGCSVNPDTVNEEMRRDFALYDLIVAREGISFRFLKDINPNTVMACDPAFTLKEERLPLPNNFKEGKTIGINISPLIQKNEKIQGITYSNYLHLLRYIINNTDYNIALIPHVVQSGNDDREPLNRLYEEINDEERICLIDDCNCMQLKGYISRCSMFIGARTHATIAAYSSCVPTLVVGYSTKAKGIARDLFDTDENYVLAVQSLQSEEDLTSSFIWMSHNQSKIRKRLIDVIPKYRNGIFKIKDIVYAL